MNWILGETQKAVKENKARQATLRGQQWLCLSLRLSPLPQGVDQIDGIYYNALKKGFLNFSPGRKL